MYNIVNTVSVKYIVVNIKSTENEPVNVRPVESLKRKADEILESESKASPSKCQRPSIHIH